MTGFTEAVSYLVMMGMTALPDTFTMTILKVGLVTMSLSEIMAMITF